MGKGKLLEFAAEQQRRFENSTSPHERKARGHFGTPASIAQFMAGMFSSIPSGTTRILDAGAGVGMLSAAICQRFLAENSPRSLFIELWENDDALVPLLQKTLSHCQEVLAAAGHTLNFVIKTDDFVLANSQQTFFEVGPVPSFHWAILNPPYFKLRKDSPHAKAMSHVVHGQPNIYALFMAAAADLLCPNGEMAAITPRSYFNGLYFKKFRKWLLDRLVVRQIHVFDSRSEAFKSDSVLQENVILHAEKNHTSREVILSNSTGSDLSLIERTFLRYDEVVDDGEGDCIIRVVANRLEQEIVARMDALPHRFRSLGLEISTGPVVTFRSTEHLRQERSKNTAPLLWMHNVRPFITQNSLDRGKPSHIEVCASSQRLLVPAKIYILLKRFTAKEEKRRLVAGIMTPADSYSKWVGLENHLNYVYRRNSELDQAEAFGLAAYFNSALVDRYFRAISGNTQVNATEIRSLPMPDESTLRRIGAHIQSRQITERSAIDVIVGEALSLPQKLIDQIAEVAS